MPLTAARAKPSVPFGGTFRLVDFALSNLVNSRYLHVVVLTQYKSHSLDRHIARTWRMSPLLGNYVAPVPAQQRRGKHWYMGSADAIYQCVNIIEDEKPDIVVIVGADHVYRMDFSQMVDAHIESGADFTVAGIRQPIEMADQFGVVDVDPDEPRRDAGVPREADRIPTACPTAPTRFSRRWATTSPRSSRCSRRSRPTPKARLEARHGRRHRPLLRGQGHVRPLRLRLQRRARLHRPRPGLLARRGNDRLVLRRAHGPHRRDAGLQRLQRQVAAPPGPHHAARPPSSSTRRRAAWATPPIRWSRPA